MVSNKTLLKIAGFGGFLTAGLGFAANNVLQQRVRKTDCYKEAIKILYDHPKAVKHLGEPVKEGRVKLGETEIDKIKWFNVPLKGSNTNGALYCQLLPQETPDKKSEIAKIELSFDDIPNKTFVLKE